MTGQRIRREETLLFNFRVKFYPETVEDEIIQNSTLTLFYAQVNFNNKFIVLGVFYDFCR